MDKFIDIIKNFNFAVAFNQLSNEQMIMAALLFLLALLAGFFFGGAAFYISGVRKGKKLVKNKKNFTAADLAYQKREQESLDKMFDEEEILAKDVIVGDPELEFPEDTLTLEVEATSGDVVPDNAGLIMEEVSQVETEGGEKSEGIIAELEDEEFCRLAEERRANVPVLTRDELLLYAESLRTFGRVSTVRRSKSVSYDKVQISGNTFMVVYERKSTAILLLRLHTGTAAKLKAKIGDCICAEPSVGEDWYSCVFEPKKEIAALMMTTVKMAYKYVFSKEFYKDVNGKIICNEELTTQKEQSLTLSLVQYDYTTHAKAVALSNIIDEQYHIDYFSKSEICEFAEEQLNDIVPTNINLRAGNKPATLKAENHMYCIVYERAGIVKVIFRADDEYVDMQRNLHHNICESAFPASRDWTWYSAVIDQTYSQDMVKDLIRYSYEYVTSVHELAPTAVEEDTSAKKKKAKKTKKK